MNAVVKINPNLPAAFQGAAREVFDEFSKGVQAGFPVISYRGKVWRVKKGGEEQVYLDDNQEAVPSIELVLVRSNPNLAKIFYENAYTEGDNAAPRCWSANGIHPDPGVQNPIAKNCAACVNNAWGSKITPAGKKTRACADHRRIAVAFRHDVEAAALDGKHEVTMLLLRVPPASLNPLKDFIEKVLQPKGVPPFAVFVRVGFEPTAAHPQLKFKGAQFLNDDQARVVMALRESEDTKRILAEATEYGTAAGTTGDGDGESEAAGDEPAEVTAAAAPAPAASKPKPAAKPKPVEEEAAHSAAADDEADDIAPPAGPVVIEGEAEEIAAPAPAKVAAPAAAPKAAKKAAKPKPAAPAPVEEEAELEAAAPAAKPAAAPKAAKGDQSFDDMLNSLLDD